MTEVLAKKLPGKPTAPMRTAPPGPFIVPSQNVMESFVTMFTTSEQPTRLVKQWFRFFKGDSLMADGGGIS